MIAAIYARKSTEQNGVAEEEKSVTRQIEHAKAYAVKKGWTVPDELIFVDDGFSGAEFVKRPGFLRLMNALKPHPPFQVVIMSEESRLGRESIETSYALKQIMDACVRVFFYLEDRERTLCNAMDKVMLSLANFASEMEREKASQRTHDAMLRKAKAGHVVGGKIFGYNNIDVFAEDTGINGDRKRSHVIRGIDLEEARVVVRIFERFSSGGVGLRTIAKELNAEGILPPTKHRKGWSPSCIRAILLRELYRGQVIWNKSQSYHRNGTQTSRKRPESEWLRFEVEALRIVPQELWLRVVRRFEHTKSQYIRSVGGQLFRRPSGVDMRSEYLLSGLAQCVVCGGSMVCQKRGFNHGKNVYMCVYHHNRGPEICSNDLRINQGNLEASLLRALSEKLDERMVKEALHLASAKLRAARVKVPDERLAMDRQLASVDTRLQHLVNAIATGKATEVVYSELAKQEAVKVRLVARLSGLEQLDSLDSLDGKRTEKVLLERAADVRGLLGRHVTQTRQLLRKLLREDGRIVNGRRCPGRIICTPFNDARGRGYALTAQASYAGFLSEKVLVNDGGGGQGS